MDSQLVTHGMATSTEERALVLLGQGISAEATAAACGVSVSRISQLLSLESFAAKVAELRFASLEKHNKQDATYDSLEQMLTEKLEHCIPLMMRPMEILKSIQIINAAKRRGQSAPESIHETQTVVNITLPAVIVNNFTNSAILTNTHNQVVKIGDTDLTTMQSGTLLSMNKAAQDAQETLAAPITVLPTPAPTPILETKSNLVNLNHRDGHTNGKRTSTPKDRSPENI